MHACEKRKRAARRRRGSVVRKGFDERKDCLRKRHPARRRLAERRFRFDRVVVRARVFVGGFPERRPALGRLARRAGSRRRKAPRVERRPPRVRLSGTFRNVRFRNVRDRNVPERASSETSRATESRLRASWPFRAAARARPWPRRRVRRQRVFLERLVFSLVLETTSSDHAPRPLSAASLASAPKGGRSSRSWNSRHPSAQTSAGRPNGGAPRTRDGARPTSPARGRWAWWFARTATPRGSGPAASKTRGRRRRGRSRSRGRRHGGARRAAHVFFPRRRRGLDVLGLDVLRHGAGPPCMCATRARRTRAGAARPPRRGLQGAVRRCPRDERSSHSVEHGHAARGPTRLLPLADEDILVLLASRAGTRTSCALEGHDVVVRGHRGVHEALAARLSSESSGGSKHCFSASGRPRLSQPRRCPQSTRRRGPRPSRPSSRSSPCPSETLAQRYRHGVYHRRTSRRRRTSGLRRSTACPRGRSGRSAT